MKAFDQELTSGSVLRTVWKLAWPLVLLNLTNGLHAFVDHVLIGHFVGSADNAGNAAVGVAWQVFLVIVVMIASLFHGMNVLVARYAGKQDREQLSRVFYETLLASAYILLFVVAPIGYIISPHLLAFVHADPEVQRYALPYLRVLFTCSAPLFLMFLVTGAFQASGDPKTPLKLGILTTLLNIALSILLITGAGPFPKLGVLGAALGTVLAPWVSIVIAVRLILKRRMILQPPRRFTLVPDPEVIRIVGRIGLPTGIQGVLLNLSGVFLLKYIGSLENSAAAQAAYTICYAQLFSLVAWTSFGLRAAAATAMGQNIGAGDPARGKAAVATAAGMGVLWASGIGLLYWFIPGHLLALFNAVDEPIFGFGVSLLHYLAFAGVALAASLSLTGGIQGAGQTKIPMYIAFATQIVLLLSICQYFVWRGTLSTEVIWAAILVSQTARLLLTFAVFRTEGWAHTRVELSQ